MGLRFAPTKIHSLERASFHALWEVGLRVQSGTYSAAMLALVVAAAACGSDSGTNNGNIVVSVAIVPTATTLPVGAVEHLSGIALDAEGNSILGAAISWSSSNTAIATVDGSGNVHGLNAGTVTVTASSEGTKGTASVLVTAGSGGSIHEVFSTYLGGLLQDQIRDVAVDAQGNIYIAGGTESTGWPTTAGAYDRTPNGNYDVFVAKLSPQGQLIWSTLIGGPGYDRAYGIELDAQGFIYIAGRAGAGFPTTAGSFQPTFSGGTNDPTYGPEDGFVCKVAPDGASVVFCSYMGSSDNRIIRDLALDSQGNIFLASSSDAGTFPASWFTNAYQRNRLGGVDGLLVKVSNDGSQVFWATFFGGSGDEAEQPSVRVDAAGNAFVLTGTESPDAPTPNGFDHTMGGLRDLYLVKLSSTGSQLLFGTYVGGSGNEGVETHELALDPQGNPVIGNSTTSTDFPTTAGVFQRSNLGLTDAFIARISADGSQLLTSTLLGGSLNDASEGICIDAAGNIYITGNSESFNLPYLVGGFQPTNHGGNDMIVVKLSPDLRTVLYGSYLGGTGPDFGRAGAVTPDGQFIIGGTTQSTDFPTLLPVQSSPGGILDAALTKISP